ncbi:MAG TPA: LemA family protein [Ferruginibacter sp.]|nr:LemA family protein [Ferruginibacter sp.]HRO16819.1 LemA family protein [Ferruginibacter sp.]HRQ20191.1 LemA family protein [Ferruginibacter sp.]
MKSFKYIGIGVLLILLVYIWSTFNAFVKKEEKMNLQWGELQNVYQRRLELIPNLVNVVKGLSEFEKEALESVTKARSKAASVQLNNMDKANYEQQQAAQNELAAATNRLIIAVERYPDIQGTKSFVDLQVQLEGTERRIKVARKDFNESVRDFNESVRRFPSSLVAKIFGFSVNTGFQSDAGAENSVEIKF